MFGGLLAFQHFVFWSAAVRLVRQRCRQQAAVCQASRVQAQVCGFTDSWLRQAPSPKSVLFGCVRNTCFQTKNAAPFISGKLKDQMHQK